MTTADPVIDAEDPDAEPADAHRAPPTIRSGRPTVIGVLALFVVAVATTTLHLRGLVVADARLEHLLAPRQFLGRHLWAWDDARGAGLPAIYFSPTVASMQTLFDLIALPPWLIGRLTLAVYLTLAGWGAMTLSSRLLPEHRWMPILTGFLYAFSPFTSQFLLPSGLFVPAVALPWLLVVTLDAIRDRRYWTHAARFALVVFTVGILNTASLLYSLFPVAVFAVLIVALERDASWRIIAAFTARVALLTVGVSTAMFFVLTGSLTTATRSISTTELPTTVAQTSTASESFRGLGFWLSYFRIGTAERPGASPFFTSNVVIALTFVPVFVAIVGVASRRVQYWRSWTAILAVGVLLMVGANRVGDTPFTVALSGILDDSTAARAFRSAYKAGPGPMLAVALLAPAGVLALVRAAGTWTSRSRSTLRASTAVAASVACLAGALPFAGGWILDEADTYDDLPGYWQDFFEEMDRHPDDRVLVLPGVSRHRYEWGYVNDNLFDAMLAAEAVFVQTVAGATSPYAWTVAELDGRITADTLEPEAFAPLLRLLGIRWVLVQNDVVGIPFRFPPRLRSAPDVALASSFGAVDGGAPALELFEVAGDDPLDARWVSGQPTIVSGGEGVVANVLRAGWEDTALTNFTALDEARRDDLLRAGAEIVVADGSQRRAVRLGLRRTVTAVLTAATDPTRPVFTTAEDDPSTQTVLDTGRIEVGSGPDFERSDVWNPGAHAALMLDGSPQTGWRVDQRFTSALGREIVVHLDRPQLIESVTLTPLDESDEYITGLEVRYVTQGGSRRVLPVALDPGTATTIGFGWRVDRLSFVVTGVSGVGGPVGFAELELLLAGGPLEVRPALRLPTEIQSIPDDVEPPVSFVFGRLDGDEEAVFRRSFLGVRERRYDVEARLVAVDDVETGGIDDDECLTVLSLDGVGVEVRPVDGSSWTAEQIDVEGCDRIDLDVGQHELVEESAAFDVVDVTLRDTLSRRPPPPRTVGDIRTSPTSHRFVVPAGEGALVSTIPFHPGWRLDAGTRDVRSLAGFAGTVWTVGDGDASPALATYTLQRWYVLALGMTGACLVVCLVLATGWRRRRT